MTRLLIDVYDGASKIGEGPIATATGWEQERVLDKAGRFSFSMPAADPRAALLANKRVVLARSGATLVGGGVIDEIELDESGDVPTLRVSGLDLAQELTYQTVGQVTLAGSALVRPVQVLRLEDLYTSPPTYHCTLAPEAYDDNPATSFGWDGGAANGHMLYVGAGQPFSQLYLACSGLGGVACGLVLQYFDGTGWQTLTVTSDGTSVGGVPFQQPGTITWSKPSDWEQTTEGGTAGYYVRLWPAINAACGIVETLVDGPAPVADALATIATKFPAGWSLDLVAGSGATAHTVYAQFDGENVLEALIKLAELTGEHFYVTHERKVVWLQGMATGTLRAASGGTAGGRASNADLLVITRLSRKLESYEQATRVYPVGAGLGSGRLTLANVTAAPPAGYVLDKANNYVKYSATDATQVIARTVAFKDIGAINNDQRSHEIASNQLLQAAVAWLSQRVGVNQAYDLTVLPRGGVIWPGQTIRVDYRRVVAGYVVLDLHQSLNLLGTTTTVDESGVWTTRLTVSTTTVLPKTDVELLAGLAKTASTLARYPQPVEVGEVRSTDFGTLGYPLTRGNGGLTSTATTVGVIGITGGGGLAPHDIVGSWHSASGLTAGTYLRASGAASFGFDAIQDGDLPATIVRTNRQVVAGNGLTGGGSLGADVTLNVGAGTLISVAADSVSVANGTAQYQVPVTGASPFAPTWTALSAFAGAGLAFSGGVFAVGQGDGLTVAADTVGLTTPGTLSASTANSAVGNHTHAITASSNPGAASSLLKTDVSGYLQLLRLGIGTAPAYPLDVAGAARIDGDLTFVGAQSILTTADNLTLAPAGDLVLDPTGNDVLPNTNYDINLGTLSKKYLTLHAAELWVETLVAQDTLATIGGRILVGPTTTLTADLAPAATTITTKHNNLAVGDTVYLEANGQVEFMAVTAGPSGAGPYNYTVTRNLDGSGANQWYAGDAVFNTGQAGDGFIDLYSVRGVKAASQIGPTIVGSVRNSATYNDWTEHWAIGNLNGLYGYGVDTYGAAFGKYAANQPWLSVDATNGFRVMRGAPGVTLAQWDTGGNITVGQVAVNQSNVHISAGALKLRNNTTDVITLLASADASGLIARFDGVIGLGATGGIYQGTGTWDNPITGLKIWNDGGLGRIAGFNNGILQWAAETDGSLTAGGGRVVLDHQCLGMYGINEPGQADQVISWNLPWQGTNYRVGLDSLTLIIDSGTGQAECAFRAIEVGPGAGDVLGSGTLVLRSVSGEPNGAYLSTNIQSSIELSGAVITMTGYMVSMPYTSFRNAVAVGLATDAQPGQIKVEFNENRPGLILAGATAGWASGLQLANTTPGTGRTFGMYAASDGRLYISDVSAAQSRICLTSNGNVLVGTTTEGAGKLQVNGGIRTTWSGSTVITLTPNAWNTITHNLNTTSLYILATNGDYGANGFTVSGVQYVDSNSFRFWASGGGAATARVNWLILAS